MSERVEHYPGKLELPYTWHYGKVLSRFFEGLKNMEFLASRCPRCMKVSFPPVPVCSMCFVPVEDELISLEPRCTVETYTIVKFTYPGQLMKPPYAVAILKPAGAHTRFHHLIWCPNLETLHIGMEVEPVWREER